MLLIGTMNLTRTREQGIFYCPTCRGDFGYRLRARRPFLTLYFIPTVPVGGVELFVQCDQCRSAWDPSVLATDRAGHEAAEREQFLNEAIRGAVLVVIADGKISESEIETLRHIASTLLDRPVDREEIGHLCSIASQNRIEAKNYLLTVSKRWSQEQRRVALQAVFLAATAEGDLSPNRLGILTWLRELLDMTDQEYQEAIEEALQWEAAAPAWRTSGEA